jgi:hypothetical protein
MRTGRPKAFSDRWENWKKLIADYLAAYNKAPKSFVWTATADLILGKVQTL